MRILPSRLRDSIGAVAVVGCIFLTSGAVAAQAVTVGHSQARVPDNDDDSILPVTVKWNAEHDGFTYWYVDDVGMPVFMVAHAEGFVSIWYGGTYVGTVDPDFSPLPGPNGETTYARLGFCVDWDGSTPDQQGTIEFFSFGIDDLHHDISTWRDGIEAAGGSLYKCPDS